MKTVIAKSAKIIDDTILIKGLWSKTLLKRTDITGYKILKIPSLFDEIGIELHSFKTVLVTERVLGFFDVAKFLHVQERFGPDWYHDVESDVLIEG